MGLLDFLNDTLGDRRYSTKALREQTAPEPVRRRVIGENANGRVLLTEDNTLPARNARLAVSRLFGSVPDEMRSTPIIEIKGEAPLDNGMEVKENKADIASNTSRALASMFSDPTERAAYTAELSRSPMLATILDELLKKGFKSNG